MMDKIEIQEHFDYCLYYCVIINEERYPKDYTFFYLPNTPYEQGIKKAKEMKKEG